MKPTKPLKLQSKTKVTGELPGAGLRQRKRQQTRDRITEAAMQLFLADGFEATTLDHIAAAADISRRSFFHYFASKEDVVIAWQDGSTAAMTAAIAARPADEPMLTAAENAVLALARQFKPKDAMAMARLKRDTPALRAREQLKYENMERAMADALAARTRDSAEQVRARLVAMITTGAIRLASDNWMTAGAREGIEALVKRTFGEIRAILGEPPVPLSETKPLSP
ncbi:MAG: Transcriptional regulator TetR family [Tardiphaga sp.]|jgi:AcrR family transcriptional regulator|nr:Transcriptional regulator TetR family [Tardiphaga sp.]